MEITSGYELSPLTAQYVDLMTCHPYKEGLSFEPLLKEIFTTLVDLKLLYFLADLDQELPWYLKQFAKKLEYFDENSTKNVYYIDNKEVLPKANIAKATLKDEDAIGHMIHQAQPKYPHSISKQLRGFTETSHEPFMILGSYQEPLGIVVIDQKVDVDNLSREYHISAFNHFLAPQTQDRKLSELKINCFQLETFYMEQPGNPVQVLMELFDKFRDKDYCIMLLPRNIMVSKTIARLFFRVSPKAGYDPDQELFVCHKASLRGGIKVTRVKLNHMTGLASLVREEVKSDIIMRDIRHSLDTDGSDADTLVATCYGQVIGVGVIRTEYETDHLRRSYDGQIGDDPVRLHHLIIAPVFQRFARHFIGKLICQSICRMG